MRKFVQIKIDEVLESSNQEDVKKGLRWIFLKIEEVKIKDSTLIEKKAIRLKSMVKLEKTELEKEHLLEVEIFSISNPGGFVQTYYRVLAIHKKL
jgi:hypothetical protein